MAKRKVQGTDSSESFGARLTRLRKAAGYSLRELATEVGVSHRMLVYYEKHSEHRVLAGRLRDGGRLEVVG